MPNKSKDKKLTAFGKKVKKRLIDLDMEQKDLAKALGVSSMTVSHILYGERSGEEWIPKICAALDMNTRSVEARKGA